MPNEAKTMPNEANLQNYGSIKHGLRDIEKVFCQKHGIDCITHAKKPFPKGIRECLNKYGRSPWECAIAGDQIFTDTLGGNCAGAHSILVTPIHLHNIWLTLRHWAEKPFIFLGKRRNGRNLPIL